MSRPLANGGNGRDASERFTKGNAGGLGNPYARGLRQYRSGVVSHPREGGSAKPVNGQRLRMSLEGEDLGEQSYTGADLRGRRPDRYHGLPLVVIQYPDGSTRPAPFLMGQDEVAAFFRLHESKTKFPEKTIQRYRRMGLRTVRVGRRVWFRLDDVLRFLDDQQDRLRWA